jgi:RND family efflux transporter MFP subunit
MQEAMYETQAAQAKMQSALSELELAQSNLAKTNLKAPSYGILAEILIKPGEYVTPQDVVAKFISSGDTNFEVDVPEKDVQKLKMNMKVKVNCDAYPGKDFIGTIKEIAPTVKERTRTTTVKIAITNPESQLRSGMFGRGKIYLVELENVMVVPQDSVISLGDTTFLVPVLKPDMAEEGMGMIEMRHVQLGQKVSQSVIITDGLEQDELVVIETQGQLSDGIQVKYVEVEPETEHSTGSNEAPGAPDPGSEE